MNNVEIRYSYEKGMFYFLFNFKRIKSLEIELNTSNKVLT